MSKTWIKFTIYIGQSRYH